MWIVGKKGKENCRLLKYLKRLSFLQNTTFHKLLVHKTEQGTS